MKILNMTNHELSERAKKVLYENFPKHELITVPFHVNLKKDVFAQMKKLISELMIYLTDPEGIAIILPAVNYLAVLFIVVTHGIHGNFPKIITLIREDSIYIVKDIFDLAALRNSGRLMRIDYLKSKTSTGDEKIHGLYERE